MDRAALVAQAWEQHPGRNHEGTLSVTVGGRVISIAHIEYGEENGASFVDVWVGRHRGKPAFRMCNPPTLIKDLTGGVSLDTPTPSGGVRKERFSVDPVAAVAETIANIRSGR